MFGLFHSRMDTPLLSMKNQTERPILSLSWQTLSYGFGIFGRQVVILLSIPLLTAFLSQDEFGAIAVIISFLAFINVISNGGLPTATYRMYNDSPDIQNRRYIIGSSLLLFSLYALFIGGITLALSKQLSAWLLDDIAFANVIRFVSLLLFLFTLLNFGYLLLRIRVRPFASSLLQLIQVVAEIGLALLLLASLDLGISGYWLGRLAGILVAMVIMAYLVRNMLAPLVSVAHLKELVRYATPLVPTALALWALRLVDRGLITSMIGLNEVAIYEVGYKIGILTALFLAPFRAAWPQFAFSTMHKPNALYIYRNVLTYITIGSLFIALVTITFSPELVQFMAPPEYAAAVYIVPWVALSQVAWTMYAVLSLGPKIRKRTSHLAWVAGIAALVNIGLNLLLIPLIGIQGAAVATLVAYMTLAGLAYVVGQKMYTIPIDTGRLIKSTVMCIVLIIVVFQVERMSFSSGQSLLIRLIVLLLFPACLLFFGVVTRGQVRALIRSGLEVAQSKLNHRRKIASSLNRHHGT